MNTLRYPRLPALLGDMAGTAAWLGLRLLTALPAALPALLAAAIAWIARPWPDSLVHRAADDLRAVVTSPFGPELLRRLGRTRHAELRDIVRGALLRPWA